MAEMPRLRVLGSLTLSQDGRDLLFSRSRRIRRALAALTINRGEVLSADRLADIVWPAHPPVDSRAALHTIVSRLRSKLAGLEGIEIVSRPPGYVLRLPRRDLDATVFEEHIRAARSATDLSAAGAHLDAALQLWRGPAYAEFVEDDFARPEATRLNGLRLQAQDDRMMILLAMGSYEEVIGHFAAMTGTDRLRERAQEQFILALYRSGRIADALAAYQDYRRTLRRELGLEPGPELIALERRILGRDLQLSQPAADALVPAALPRLSGSLIGRDGDLSSIDALLRSKPIVTLVGTGGIGKTQLALAIADRVAGRFQDGVIICMLGSISDGTQVVDLVASALDLLPVTTPRTFEDIARHVAGRRMLLVLDNCEHLLAATSALISQIGPNILGVQILATSRQRLGIHEEQSWHVQPLTTSANSDLTSDASALFIMRARSADPSFAPGPEVAELCRRLDGIPLALELAAARVASTTVQEILDRLDEHRLLTASARHVPARHRSLNSVFDWSYDLLDTHHRSVFNQLSVFPDDFDLDAAAGVVQEQTDVESCVVDLVERSLVRHHSVAGRSRYSLLQTLRRYGLRHLRDQGRLDIIQDQHAMWYVTYAHELATGMRGSPISWLLRLAQETANLRAAHRRLLQNRDAAGQVRLAEALHHYALFTLNAEAFDWARQLITSPGADASPLLSAAYATAADGAWLVGDAVGCQEYAQSAISLTAGTSGSARWYALIAAATALAAADQAFAARAELYREASDIAAALGATTRRILADILQASCLREVDGQHEIALKLAENALWDARRADAPDLEAKARLVLGDLALRSDPSRALQAYRTAAEISARAGNRFQIYQTLISSAFAELLYGAEYRAAQTFRDLLTQWAELLRGVPLASVLQGVVILLVRGGCHEDAAVICGGIPEQVMTIAFTVDPGVPRQFAEARQAAAGRLGGHFGRALDRGRQLQREQIIALATSALNCAQPPWQRGGQA